MFEFFHGHEKAHKFDTCYFHMLRVAGVSLESFNLRFVYTGCSIKNDFGVIANIFDSFAPRYATGMDVINGSVGKINELPTQ